MNINIDTVADIKSFRDAIGSRVSRKNQTARRIDQKKGGRLADKKCSVLATFLNKGRKSL